MYLEVALKKPDKEEFVKAMYKELQDYINTKHWKAVPATSVPRNKIPMPMVWSMKRKRNPIGEVIKYKARLCAGGHKSLEFMDYWDTYSPIMSWNPEGLNVGTDIGDISLLLRTFQRGAKSLNTTRCLEVPGHL